MVEPDQSVKGEWRRDLDPIQKEIQAGRYCVERKVNFIRKDEHRCGALEAIQISRSEDDFIAGCATIVVACSGDRVRSCVCVPWWKTMCQVRALAGSGPGPFSISVADPLNEMMSRAINVTPLVGEEIETTGALPTEILMGLDKT